MRKTISIPAILAAMILSPQSSHAAKIADITRLDGQQNTYLTGLGLVFGLNGSGDGGEFSAAIKPLAEMLAKLRDPVSAAELTKAQNVAVVELTATVPNNGVQAGDRLDVRVTSIGAAHSLKGGRLFVAPMQGPVPGAGRPLALAEGPVRLEDPSEPLAGVVKAGAIMDVSIRREFVDHNGKFTLILDDPATATWTPASAIARVINDAEGEEGRPLAVAIDNKRVEVTIPPDQRERPDGFISRIQSLPISPKYLTTDARVEVNEKTGTLIVTGDVEISPVVISHKGLTISTIVPTPIPTARQPVINARQTVALDTTNEGGAKLQDLVNALEQLKVPAADRITIVEELYKTGKLHARLVRD